MKFFNKTCFAGLGLLLSNICFVSFASAVPSSVSKNINSDLQIHQAYQRLFKTPNNKKAVVKHKNTQVKNKTIPARFRAVAVAKKQIRKKYRWGGSTPKTGFDCSGLTYYAFKSVNINIPRTARAQYKHTKRIPLAKLQAGDLIFFHTRRTRARVNHVGIYLGNGKFIHAPRKGKRVSIAKLSRYWRKKAVGAGRV